MTPYQKAARVYSLEPCARTFQDDLNAHLQNGCVFSRPDLFLMGRPVVKDAAESLIIDPWMRFPSGFCDCWHVYLMAGNMAKALELMPWYLPWISFERGNVLRYWPTKRLTRGIL